MDHLDGKVGHKYNHHDVQNELLNIMAAQVLREKLATIRDHIFCFNYDRGRYQFGTVIWNNFPFVLELSTMT